ncbi:MAG: radical SAM family heme chaperone HemW [Gammaproteobacteria bacterium]|jgi:oxygen-independent coproporphyrinogen-3 oxidase|nr:YggW family oxidoreductase [Gammaproteobacteria bacterium]MDP6096232.1 radical SAM family heme chaperone HemW [Gammaproteobacteria bacterium]
MLELPPLSLYIHIPWCVRKCPYCDFNSHESPGAIPELDYVAALLKDFHQELPQIQNRTLHSVFIGGGTPSLLSGKSIAALLDGIEKSVGFSDHIEITLEANPGTAEAKKFAEFHSAGINRLSLGIQSFDDRHLLALGRIHNAVEARLAIDFARAAGFDNLNLDIMYGLPRQSPDQAVDDLQTACELEPSHLSWYQLTLEPNTLFFRRPPALPAEDSLEQIRIHGMAALANKNFQQYEVSAFSRPSRLSAHNVNYWQFGDYLGIGAGAHGKQTDPGNGQIRRTRKIRQPAHYLQSDVSYMAEAVAVDPDQRPLEFLMNTLRLKRGFTTQLFESRTGLPFSTIEKKVEYLISKNFLVKNGDNIVASDRGYLLLNSLLEEFL